MPTKTVVSPATVRFSGTGSVEYNANYIWQYAVSGSGNWVQFGDDVEAILYLTDTVETTYNTRLILSSSAVTASVDTGSFVSGSTVSGSYQPFTGSLYTSSIATGSDIRVIPHPILPRSEDVLHSAPKSPWVRSEDADDSNYKGPDFMVANIRSMPRVSYELLPSGSALETLLDQEQSYMIGGRIEIKNPVIDTTTYAPINTPLAFNIEQIEDVADPIAGKSKYRFNVDNKLLARNITENFDEFIDFENSPYTMSYVAPVSMSWDIRSQQSYADVELSGLRTYSGAIRKVRLYYRDRNEFGDYKLMGEQTVDSVEHLAVPFSVNNKKFWGRFGTSQTRLGKRWYILEGTNAGLYRGTAHGTLVDLKQNPASASIAFTTMSIEDRVSIDIGDEQLYTYVASNSIDNSEGNQYKWYFATGSNLAGSVSNLVTSINQSSVSSSVSASSITTNLHLTASADYKLGNGWVAASGSTTTTFEGGTGVNYSVRLSGSFAVLSGSNYGHNQAVVFSHSGSLLNLSDDADYLLQFTAHAVKKPKQKLKQNGTTVDNNLAQLKIYISGSCAGSSKLNPKYGKYLGYLDLTDKNKHNFRVTEHEFTVPKGGNGVLQFVATSGLWKIKNISVKQSTYLGISPDYYDFSVPVPADFGNDRVYDFKLEYLSADGTIAKQKSWTTKDKAETWEGSNTVITGNNNILYGSLFLGGYFDSNGKFKESGFDIHGGSAYIKSVGYRGYKSASMQSTYLHPDRGVAGIMMWSGSVLTSSTDEYDFPDVGFEIHGGQNVNTGDVGAMRFRTRNGGALEVSGSIQAYSGRFARTFAVGYGSGSIEISASASESIIKTQNWTGPSSREGWAISGSGQAWFQEGYVAGWQLIRLNSGSAAERTVLSGSNLTLDADGSSIYKSDQGPGSDTSSQALLFPQLANEYYIDFTPSGSEIISSSGYYVKFGPNFSIDQNGILFASGAYFQGSITASAGLIGGFVIETSSLHSFNDQIFISGSPAVGGVDDPTYMFISSSNFNIKQNGDITGSKVLFDGGKIGGWNIDDVKIYSDNLYMYGSGILETSDFSSGIKGWQISSKGNGHAEFENAKIRGTLATTVFEKETVNAMGGQFAVTNATTISGSHVSASATTMSVENVSGFTVNEILAIKKLHATGFSTEYVLVASTSRVDPSSATDFTGDLYVTRAYQQGTAGYPQYLFGSGSTAQAYEPGQVVASTGKTNTGYIKFNANSSDPATPYIDIVERTGSGIYDLELKARLGDLSGLSVAQVGASPGFGLYSENVFLTGTISASAGHFGGFSINDDALTGPSLFISGSPLAGGVDDDRYKVLSTTNFNIKQNGDITGSSALFEGSIDVTGTGTIAGFVLDTAEIRSSGNALRLKANGQITASSADITGKITAQSGTIGSFTIGTYLYTGTKTAWNDANAGVHLGSDGIGIGNNIFTVNGSTGALVASSATITGVVTANTGYIGGTSGWVIASGKMTSTGIGVATTTGDATYAFWAGNNTPASAEFSVKHDGTLTATSADITGDITATTGTIGSWNITGDNLWTGANDSSGYATSGMTISATNGTIHTPNWYVDSTGKIISKAGNYETGTHNLQGTFVVRPTIGSGNNRVEIDGATSQIRLYNTTGTNVLTIDDTLAGWTGVSTNFAGMWVTAGSSNDTWIQGGSLLSRRNDGSAAVYAVNQSSGNAISAQSDGAGNAVGAKSTGAGSAVYGQADSTGYAGEFMGAFALIRGKSNSGLLYIDSYTSTPGAPAPGYCILYVDGTEAATTNTLHVRNGSAVYGIGNSDTVYGAGWNGDTHYAPTKNAVYDKINAMDSTISSNTTHRTSNGTDHTYINQNVTTTGTPTFNQVTVDNITLNAAEIDVSTNLTIDSSTGVIIHSTAYNSDANIYFGGGSTTTGGVLRYNWYTGNNYAAMEIDGEANSVDVGLRVVHSLAVGSVYTTGLSDGQIYASSGAKIGTTTGTGLAIGNTAIPGTNGLVRATNNIVAYYSDKRLKNITGTIQNPLDKIIQLSGVYYKENKLAKKYGYEDETQKVGVIAQDVQKVLPEAVTLAPFDIEKDENDNDISKSGENYLTVQYEKLIPLLIESIKELKAEIDKLKKNK